jgi:hypothetical protein
MNQLLFVRANLTVLFLLLYFLSYSQINSYSINQTLAGPSQLTLDIDNDGSNDYTFDIITLQPGVYAARANAANSSKILDNSNFGYPDTLNFNDPVVGNFDAGGVLGTFNNAGQFKGAGNKYLGIRINSGNSNFLGWIELNCSPNNDTLQILTCGFNTISGDPIKAGQTIGTNVFDNQNKSQEVKIFPNPCSTEVMIVSAFNTNSNYAVYSSIGQEVLSGIVNNKINISILPNGVYTLKIQGEVYSENKKIIVSH